MGGSLLLEEIKDIKGDIKIFVETGTYKGDTICAMSPHFETLYTTEISEERYQESLERGRNLENIAFLKGDSIQLLGELVPVLKDEKVMYFLDAHVSGYDTTYNGNQLVPLIQELEVILSGTCLGCIFIIDDVRFWVSNNKPHDWSHISREGILNLFKQKAVEVKKEYFLNDRYWIFT